MWRRGGHRRGPDPRVAHPLTGPSVAPAPGCSARPRPACRIPPAGRARTSTPPPASAGPAPPPPRRGGVQHRPVRSARTWGAALADAAWSTPSSCGSRRPASSSRASTASRSGSRKLATRGSNACGGEDGSAAARPRAAARRLVEASVSPNTRRAYTGGAPPPRRLASPAGVSPLRGGGTWPRSSRPATGHGAAAAGSSPTTSLWPWSSRPATSRGVESGEVSGAPSQSSWPASSANVSTMPT